MTGRAVSPQMRRAEERRLSLLDEIHTARLEDPHRGGNDSKPKKPRAKKVVVGVPPAALNGSHTSKADRFLAAARAVDECEAALELARAELKDALGAFA